MVSEGRMSLTVVLDRLIVVAILVELGEVIARLIVHATMGSESSSSVASSTISSLASSDIVRNVTQLSREEALRRLEEMVLASNPGAK